MQIIRFYERIHCWLWLCENMPFSPSKDKRISRFIDWANNKWYKEMLTDIATIDIPMQLKGTPVEYDLANAIALAQSGERARIIEIYNRLYSVNNYLLQNLLSTSRIISIN